MTVFLVAGLEHTGKATVVRHLKDLTGFQVLLSQPLRPVGWFKKHLTKDRVDEEALEWWHQIKATLESEQDIIIHRACHPYVLHRLTELLGGDAVHLLMCRCSEYRRYVRKGEIARNFLLDSGRNENENRDIEANRLLLSAGPTIVDTEDDDKIPEHLRHILFELGIANVEPHIQNNPS